MNRYFACLVLAGAALVSYPRATVVASPASSNTDVDILVGGVPQRHYAHADRWYVEAIKGREYAIRLHNPYSVRVAIALSVDGLNTIDARVTTASDARKWVLNPFETVTISGWQTSRTHARRFEFTTEEQSYGKTLGKTANLGVISAAFFRERAPVFSLVEPTHDRARAQEAPQAPAPAAEASAAAGAGKRADNEYAATGMGRRTEHAVQQVWLDIEDSPAKTVTIRYEFRPQLVRLGILPSSPVLDPLSRREGAHGFEPEFSPEIPIRR
jgi:hypothetical protein